MFAKLKKHASVLKTYLYTLYLAVRHPETPWYAKVFALLVLGNALSPIDLVPDFIPVLGYLDDLILVPLGIWLSLKMIPKPVYEECRLKSQTARFDTRAKWVIASGVSLLWLFIIYSVIKAIVAAV